MPALASGSRHARQGTRLLAKTGNAYPPDWQRRSGVQCAIAWRTSCQRASISKSTLPVGRSVLPSRIYARPTSLRPGGKAGDFAIGGANIDNDSCAVSGINRAPRHSENTIQYQGNTGTRPMAMRLPLKISSSQKRTGYRHQGNWRPGRWSLRQI